MLEEALVLIGDQHLDEGGIDVVERGRQPPGPVAGGIGAQQRPVAVDDLLRHREPGVERRRKRPVEAFERGPGGEEGGRCDGGPKCNSSGTFLERHRCPSSACRHLLPVK
jgi:hypothetical protein